MESTKNNYVVLEEEGYTNPIEAKENILLWYSHLKGVTTHFNDGKWYIVQSNTPTC